MSARPQKPRKSRNEKRQDGPNSQNSDVDRDVDGEGLRGETFRLAVEAAPSAMILTDSDGEIRLVNRQAEKYFGYTREELVGQSIEILVPDQFSAAHIQHRVDFMVSPCSRPMGLGRDLYAKRKDGTELEVEIGLNPIETSQGWLVLMSVVDITERKRAEHDLRQAKEQAQSYLDIAAVVMIALDARGNVTLINKKGCDVLGSEPEQIIGKNWFDHFVPANRRERVRDVFDEILHGRLEEVESYENSVLSKDGREIPIEWHNTWIRDEAGDIVGSLSSGIDLSEKKLLTEQLIERESLARLGELSAMVAHEVKNPLAGITGGMQMLERRVAKDSFEHEILKEMIHRVDGLTNTVRDILSFARPRTPDAQLVPLRMLIEDTVSSVSEDPHFEEIDVDISGPDVMAPCDIEMVKAVFLNLLMNAAQAMKGDGRVLVTLEHHDSERLATISFRDGGPGIPKDQRTKIFEPFFTTKGEGTGLGLSIAKRAIELHGGSISLECPAEGGATFSVHLPLGELGTQR